VSAGEARGTVQRAQRTPNKVLRGIRENDRHETRPEFAGAMARVAREIGEEVYQDENYVYRLEPGAVSWPNTAYRRILVELCGRPAVELGFSPPMLSPPSVARTPPKFRVHGRIADGNRGQGAVWVTA
jgi:hypothetical protein